MIIRVKRNGLRSKRYKSRRGGSLPKRASAELPCEEKPAHLGKESSECLSWMLNYMYEHYGDFKILICCSGGTPYENFVNSMVEVEVEATLQYIEVFRELGNDVPEPDRSLCHMITSGLFEGAFKVIRHDMPKERAVKFVNKLFEFHTAGWLKLMGQ